MESKDDKTISDEELRLQLEKTLRDDEYKQDSLWSSYPLRSKDHIARILAKRKEATITVRYYSDNEDDDMKWF